jgi:hypothetical protein
MCLCSRPDTVIEISTLGTFWCEAANVNALFGTVRKKSFQGSLRVREAMIWAVRNYAAELLLQVAVIGWSKADELRYVANARKFIQRSILTEPQSIQRCGPPRKSAQNRYATRVQTSRVEEEKSPFSTSRSNCDTGRSGWVLTSTMLSPQALIPAQKCAFRVFRTEMANFNRRRHDVLFANPVIGPRRHYLRLFSREHSKIGILDLWRKRNGQSEAPPNFILNIIFDLFVIWKHLLQRSRNIPHECLSGIME